MAAGNFTPSNHYHLRDIMDSERLIKAEISLGTAVAANATWIAAANDIVQLIAGLLAIVATIFSIRYYYIHGKRPK